MSASALLRAVVQGSVTEAYDATEAALNEARKVAPDVAALIETARNLLFTARVRLDES